MDATQVGKKLVEFCRNGLNLDAISTLYSPEIVSVEAAGSDEMPAEMRGIDKVVAKNKWWYENHEIHHASAEGPFPHKDRFAVIFHYETTPKTGPQKGKRGKFQEVAIYTVKNGKIVREEFFYDMG
ncbi:MAG: nuclear transport factor 2 family protein [Thermoanaerobaculia bacterium]